MTPSYTGTHTARIRSGHRPVGAFLRPRRAHGLAAIDRSNFRAQRRRPSEARKLQQLSIVNANEDALERSIREVRRLSALGRERAAFELLRKAADGNPRNARLLHDTAER